MAEICFTASRRFGPDRGEEWRNYLSWSQLTQLAEVVSLDTVLCEPVVPPYSDDLTIEDWDHIVAEDYRLRFMRDLDYLLKRAEMSPQVQVLAAMVDPPDHLHELWSDPRFTFMGYEILDVHGDISALTNCGGWPLVFDNAELGACGLLDDLERARDVRQGLKDRYSGHGHEVCDVWAVWRMR